MVPRAYDSGMSTPTIVKSVVSREVLDSRGFPTVEVELTLEQGVSQKTGRAIVPSGASTGEGEALELRDGDAKRYKGKGVLTAVANVKNIIGPALVGRSFSHVATLDEALKTLDGTENKSKLGANAILGVSMAFARAASDLAALPTHQWIAQAYGSVSAMAGTRVLKCFILLRKFCTIKTFQREWEMKVVLHHRLQVRMPINRFWS